MRDAVRPPSQGLTHARNDRIRRPGFPPEIPEFHSAAEAGCMLHPAFQAGRGGQSGHGSQATPALQCRHARLRRARFCPIVSAWHPKHDL
jgi:hypothetical protein